MMGCIISSAVIPATLTLTWSGQNWIAAAGSPVLGLICALIAWLVTAKRECGALDVACTGSNYPMLAGNVTALLSPLVFIPVLTFAFGQQKYDWLSMAAINQGDDSDIAAKLGVDVEQIRGQAITTEVLLDETEQKHLKRSAIIARSMTVFMTLALLYVGPSSLPRLTQTNQPSRVLWPMPMYGSGYIFSKKFFTGWVVVGIMWLFFSSFCVGLFPLWQGRKTAVHTIKSIIMDITGKKRPQQALHGESQTPPAEASDSEKSGGVEGVSEVPKKE
jgi:urea-proton symporter